MQSTSMSSSSGIKRQVDPYTAERLVNTLRAELSHIVINKLDDECIDRLQYSHSLLHQTYPTLFKMVIKCTKEGKLSKLDTYLPIMFSTMKQIYNKEISKEQGDKQIGELFARIFIPQFADQR